MSVLRHGGSFLQRRLTKLYSDTKSSCESVTTVSRANDDPELVALNRNFRTQKDRLLAWGLDWSDANAAQPNDIDESLSEAGFSDVVASVMSSIQELLNEAERLQHPEIAQSIDGKGNTAGFPSGDNKSHLPVKNHWTDQDISRSKDLLAELTTLIDTLYDLSRSRRNMSMSKTSGTPSGKGTQTRPPLAPKSSKSSKESFYLASSDAKSPSSRDEKQPVRSPKETQPLEISHFLNLHMAPKTCSLDPAAEQAFTNSFFAIKHLYINPADLELSTGGSSHASNPPPYEVVAASANSRVTGLLKASAVPPTMATSSTDSTISVMAEFSPMMIEQNKTLLAPPQERLDHLSKTLHQLSENSKVSHFGLMKFLGFFIDVPCSRFAFIYELPLTIYPSLGSPCGKMHKARPEPLVSFFHSEDRQDVPVPSLENRFRLAYNLVLSVLHLRSQNLVHGNINSSNILVLPEPTESSSGFKSVVGNLHRPYLTSAAQFSGSGSSEAPSEPLSSSMYRHPDDRRVIGDDAAWAYDLYSLGLVLLEIGLWTPISRLWKMKYNNAMFKSRIENVYVKKLAPKCGNAYLQAVQLCLDAPNFHLSTQPIVDLCMRLNQTSYYPGTESNSTDNSASFSKNFLFTITKVLWRCCSLDLFSPPPVTDLEEGFLPPAINDTENVASSQIHSTDDVPESDEPLAAPESWEPPEVSDVKPPEENAAEDKKPRKRTLKKLTNLEIPQSHLDEWNVTIMPKLSKLLQKILKDSAESCSATLMITGETEETAKTTICVTCSNVKRVRGALKKYLDYDRENWDLIVLRGDIRRSKVPKKRRRKPKASGSSKSGANATLSEASLNPYYQQKPICGASIGAFRDEEHLPPVSYGGAILVDGMPYGMTVHHMLDPPSDDEEDDEADLPPRSSANPALIGEQFSTELQHSWCDEDPEISYEFEISDDEDFDDASILDSVDESFDEYWLSDDNSTDDGLDDDDYDDDDDNASIGDTAGVDPAEDPQLVVTQPAIDDIHDDFFPTLEDKDDEHLTSHSLGYIHASSGVRRWLREGVKHEVDWALIKIHEARMEPCNNIVHDTDASSSRYASKSGRSSARSSTSKPETTSLDKVAKIEELGGTKVHCCGRTSGLQTGQISKAMTLVKMHGRQSFSTSFCVHGNFGGKFFFEIYYSTFKLEDIKLIKTHF